jgi:thioredoxin reductase
MYDLIVIGGGAAALSATAYALGKQLSVLMIYENLGGKAGNRIYLRAPAESEVDYLVGHILVHLALGETTPIGEAQYAGEAAVKLFERQIQTRSGAALQDRVTAITQTAEGFMVETAANGAHESTAVLLATGVTPRALAAPGAEQYLGYGLGYSPTTHARALANKAVAVIGTSVRALRGAAELSRSASKVTLIPLAPIDLSSALLDSLQLRSNVEVLENYHLVALEGDHHLERVIVERHGQRRAVPVDAAFADLGLIPNSELVRDLVDTDEEGFIVVDERNGTSLPGLFAAGDVTTGFGEQVLIAIGDGARAALGTYDYLLTRPLMQEIGGKD